MCGVAIYSNRNDTYCYLWNISKGIVDIREILHEYIMYTYISWFRFWIGKLCCCVRLSKTQKWKHILGCNFEIHINHKITLIMQILCTEECRRWFENTRILVIKWRNITGCCKKLIINFRCQINLGVIRINLVKYLNKNRWYVRNFGV